MRNTEIEFLAALALHHYHPSVHMERLLAYVEARATITLAGGAL